MTKVDLRGMHKTLQDAMQALKDGNYDEATRLLGSVDKLMLDLIESRGGYVVRDTD